MEKQAVLLLHGALGSEQQLRELSNVLNQHNFLAYHFDFYGHGKNTDYNQAFSIPGFAEQLINFIYQHKLAPIAVFGYSMGGYVALYAALQEPNLFKSIYTLATKFAWNPQAAAQETRYLNKDFLGDKQPKFLQMLAERHTNLDYTLLQTQQLLLSLGTEPALSPEKIAGLDLPVRLAVGDKDLMVSIEETVEYYRSLLNGTMQVLPATKHPLEAVSIPKLVQALIDFWISRFR